MTAADPINQSALDDSSASRHARAVLDRILTEERQPTPPRRRARPPLRRYAWSLALTAAAAATALALISQAAGNSASGPRPATSAAAWTVAKLAHSTVLVKGSDYTHPATLEHKLRTAGVLADVKTFTWNPAACGGTEPSASGTVYWSVHGRVPGGVGAIFGDGPNGSSTITFERDNLLVLTIHPNNIPPQYVIHVRFPASSSAYAGKMVAIDVGPASWLPDPCLR